MSTTPNRPAARLRMRLPGAAILASLLALPALAQDAPPAPATPLPATPNDPPLSAEAFEALVEGRTFDTHDQTGSYGVETFLSGRRAIWRDAERCMQGIWWQEGEQICFDYEDDPFTYCWTYHDRGDRLTAWLDGDRSAAPIQLFPIDDLVTCDGFLGA